MHREGLKHFLEWSPAGAGAVRGDAGVSGGRAAGGEYACAGLGRQNGNGITGVSPIK